MCEFPLFIPRMILEVEEVDIEVVWMVSPFPSFRLDAVATPSVSVSDERARITSPLFEVLTPDIFCSSAVRT